MFRKAVLNNEYNANEIGYIVFKVEEEEKRKEKEKKEKEREIKAIIKQKYKFTDKDFSKSVSYDNLFNSNNK